MTDLSGRWRGLFSYPDGTATTAFTADLADGGGMLSGHIAEPDLFARGTIEAVLDGRRDGHAVRFTKYYDDPDGLYDAVLYAGTLDATENEISGRWDIPGVWSGPFLMVREGWRMCRSHAKRQRCDNARSNLAAIR